MNSVSVEQIDYDSGGLVVKATLFEPAGPGPFPGLVAGHGGIAGIDDGFRAKCEEVAAQGFMVIAPSFRGEDGSEGAIDIGGGDVEDTLIAAEVLRGRPNMSNDLVLWGNSRGGLVVLLAAARSKAFKAVVASAALASLQDLYEIFARRHDPFLDVVLRGPGGRPEDVPSEYERRSAVAQAGRVNCPALVMHSERDEVVPVDSARRIAAALQAGGKPCELRLYPGGGHRFILQGEHEAEATEMMVQFLRRHVGGGVRD